MNNSNNSSDSNNTNRFFVYLLCDRAGIIPKWLNFVKDFVWRWKRFERDSVWKCFVKDLFQREKKKKGVSFSEWKIL